MYVVPFDMNVIFGGTKSSSISNLILTAKLNESTANDKENLTPRYSTVWIRELDKLNWGWWFGFRQFLKMIERPQKYSLF